MRRTRVTIADLARSLDLSTCTISRILNRSFDGFTYSAETIRRVEERAKKLGYTANTQARSLRTRKTMLIGFLLPSAQVSLFGALTDQLEMELRSHGYQVLIVHSRNDATEEPALIASLLARGIDGLVWIPASDTIDPGVAGLRADFPVVILDRPFCTEAFPFVATENRAAARDLAQRAWNLGHRKIGILNAPDGDRSLRERFEGFRDVFGRSIKLAETPNDAAAAKKAVMAMLDKKVRPSLLAALSEPLAIGAIAGVRDLGLNFSKELSFVAFDDFPLAAHWSPRITVVRQDVTRLAHETAQLLLARIQKPNAKFDNLRVEATMEWRESVASLC
jgi:DNA-binding LacI/PurR family transcriptional regulator